MFPLSPLSCKSRGEAAGRLIILDVVLLLLMLLLATLPSPPSSRPHAHQNRHSTRNADAHRRIARIVLSSLTDAGYPPLKDHCRIVLCGSLDQTTDPVWLDEKKQL